MPHVKGIWEGGHIRVDRNIKFANQVIMPGNFTHQIFYVDALNGSDSDNGETLSNAKATIQAAVTLANSPTYATKNVDILVGNGLYEETVQITRAGTGLLEGAMLWQNMGSNCGYIGTLRIIGNSGVFGTGYNKWTCGAAATTPNLYIGRPNVEIHGFNMQENSDATTTAGNWGDGVEMGGHSQAGMPVICVEDQYNGETIGTLLNGAGNNVLISNCRINSGASGILNSGAKWVQVLNCHLEYCTNGVAMIANSKGRASESLIRGSQFSMNTYDVLHGYAVTCWVDRCDFVSNNATAHLYPLAAHAASTYCTMTNCTGDTISKFCGGSATVAKNNGWDGNFLTCSEGTGSIPAMGATANWNHGDE